METREGGKENDTHSVKANQSSFHAEVDYNVPSTAAITTRSIAVSVAVVILCANSSVAITCSKAEPTVCKFLALLIYPPFAPSVRTGA